MSNLHRLRWIDAMIRAERYPNCRTIAAHFEISPRQAARDIEYLRDSMGAPIGYSASDAGYYYTDKTFLLPTQLISEQEKRALSYLAYHYSRTGDALANRLAELFARLTGESATSGGRALTLPHPKLDAGELAAFEKLQAAIAQRRQVCMVYINSAGVRARRDFCPYKLFTNGSVNYAVGYCMLRQEIRVFRLSRMVQVETLEVPFEVVSYFRPEDYGETRPFRYADPYIATVQFAHAVDLSTCRLRASPLDALCVRFEFYRAEDLLADLLSHTSDFTILSPMWLKGWFKAHLEALYRRNFG